MLWLNSKNVMKKLSPIPSLVLVVFAIWQYSDSLLSGIFFIWQTKQTIKKNMTEELKVFNSYEEYLDSHLVDEDLYYLKESWSDSLTPHFTHKFAGYWVCPSHFNARIQVWSESLWSRWILQRKKTKTILTEAYYPGRNSPLSQVHEWNKRLNFKFY